jgi:hypothetical protein
MRFENRDVKREGRFRDQVWAVFAPTKRRRDHIRWMVSARHEKQSRQITPSSEIAAARNWICRHSLFVYVMAVEDARRNERAGGHDRDA